MSAAAAPAAASAAADLKLGAPVPVFAKVKEGDKFPDAELLEGNPPAKVKLSELLNKASKAIVFGVPGAFTPGCSKQHLPGYVNDFEELKKKGVDLIVCVSVNDGFVMHAWGENQNAIGKVRMLADPNADLAKALGLDKAIPVLGGVRCRRFSALVEKGTIKHILPEPEGAAGMKCSTSNHMLSLL